MNKKCTILLCLLQISLLSCDTLGSNTAPDESLSAGSLEGTIPLYSDDIVVSLSLISLSDQMEHVPTIESGGNFQALKLASGQYDLSVKLTYQDITSSFLMKNITIKNGFRSYILTPSSTSILQQNNRISYWNPRYVNERDLVKGSSLHIPGTFDEGYLVLLDSKGASHQIHLNDTTRLNSFVAGYYTVQGQLKNKRILLPIYGLWLTPDSTAVFTPSFINPNILNQPIVPRRWDSSYLK